MADNDLVKDGMEIMLRPVTDIAENALGLMGGDWLSEKRARNRANLRAKKATQTQGRYTHKGRKTPEDDQKAMAQIEARLIA